MARVFDTPINTNDQSVERVLGAGLPVALVFLDGKPAKALAQTLERLARENAGKLLVAQVQMRDNPQTTQRYQVSRPPAVVTERNGSQQSKAEAISGADLGKHVAYLLGKGPKPQASQAPQSGRATNGSGTASGSTAYGGASTGQPINAGDADFETAVLGASQPVLVDFWAPWCGPCRMTDPIVKKLAGEMAGRLRVVKVNVDESPRTAERYGIRSIPTMMVFKGGRIIDQWSGALPEGMLRARVAPHV